MPLRTQRATKPWSASRSTFPGPSVGVGGLGQWRWLSKRASLAEKTIHGAPADEEQRVLPKARVRSCSMAGRSKTRTASLFGASGAVSSWTWPARLPCCSKAIHTPLVAQRRTSQSRLNPGPLASPGPSILHWAAAPKGSASWLPGRLVHWLFNQRLAPPPLSRFFHALASSLIPPPSHSSNPRRRTPSPLSSKSPSGNKETWNQVSRLCLASIHASLRYGINEVKSLDSSTRFVLKPSRPRTRTCQDLTLSTRLSRSAVIGHIARLARFPSANRTPTRYMMQYIDCQLIAYPLQIPPRPPPSP